MKSKPLRLILATDAWHPQVNGVVRTLDHVSNEIEKMGHQVRILSHQGRKTWSLPSYPEIQLAHFSQNEIHSFFERNKPDCIHIATEGPIGLAVRKYCMKNRYQFTTGFHTKFAEYVEARIPIPGTTSLCYIFLRWFHGPSKAVLAPTASMTRELEARGFDNAVTWTRGVDHETFRNFRRNNRSAEKRPILVYVGRLAVEKGINDFLELDVPGTKLVIGDGPLMPELKQKYPETTFTGYLFGEELAKRIATGDVFVFPSKTDTFGLVMLEAMACGLPVAAYPVTGPIDVIEHGYSGWMDDNLSVAVTNALKLKRRDAVEYSNRFTWKKSAELMLDNLVHAIPG